MADIPLASLLELLRPVEFWVGLVDCELVVAVSQGLPLALHQLVAVAVDCGI